MFYNITMDILFFGVILVIVELVRRINSGQLHAGTRKAIMVGFYLYSVAWAVIFPLIIHQKHYSFRDLNEAFMLTGAGVITPTLTLLLSLKLALMFRSVSAHQQDNLIFASAVLAAVAFVFMVYTLYLPPRIAIWVIVLLFGLSVLWSLARTERAGEG